MDDQYNILLPQNYPYCFHPNPFNPGIFFPLNSDISSQSTDYSFEIFPESPTGCEPEELPRLLEYWTSLQSTADTAKYEVFISFRGSDVRRSFLSHLYPALKSKQIDAFIDDELERGRDITENLLQIIERSALSIVIFSQNYPDSEWCLEELQKIHESMKLRNHTVVPVFYQVDPSDVQDLKGNYAIQKPEWRDALVEISNLSGFDSRNSLNDAKLIDDIVAAVCKKLSEACPAILNQDGLYGIDSRITDVLRLLELDSTNDVRMVGIWGMGGIGKTTLASKVFDKIKNDFDSHCFVANVRETLSRDGQIKLRDNIIQELLNDRNISTGSAFSVGDSIRRRLKQTKVFLVLDDVHTCMQLNSLLESCGLHSRDSFCPGSRIIVTSRDSQVLRNMHLESSIYEAKQLKDDEALRLLCWRAFGQNQPHEGYTKISEELVRYSNGVPLALVVLGSQLKLKDVRLWEATLEKVKCISPQEIQKILRISFDGLDKEEKDIFLDIACFFKGCARDFLEHMLECFGFHASIGIDRLIDKSLLKDDYGCITMHDLLEQMGHEIVAEEKEIKGQQSRLWKNDDVKDSLKNNTGTENVEAIQLLCHCEDEIDIVREAFIGMHNLRYLYLENQKINCPDGLKFFPNSIKYLRWDYYPLNYLPSNYNADKLVELEMDFSKLKEIIWTKPLQNLKWVSLYGCTNLIRISDLSLAPHLEVLDLAECVNLVEVGSSLDNLNKLTLLDVRYCESLSHLPELPRSITDLVLEGSGLRRLTSTIGHLTDLTDLNLEHCEKLESLPSSISSLSFLDHISFRHCINLMELPEDFGNLKSLMELDVSYSGLRALPENFGNLESLKEMDASYSGLRALPPSIRNLKNLIKLNLKGCKELRFIPALPSSLKLLDAWKCLSLINPVSSSVVNQYFWKAHYQPTKVHHLRITGSDLPNWMMYRNDCGSSVSLDLETPGPSTSFIFCLVTWSEFSIGCLDYSDLEAILKISETECCHNYFYNEEQKDDFLESVEEEYNVFLWNCNFNCKFVKEVSFQSFLAACGRAKIIKCGVHPILHNQNHKKRTCLDRDNDLDVELDLNHPL